jgi:hypothetical protein
MSGIRRRLRKGSERIKPSRPCETARMERSGYGKPRRADAQADAQRLLRLSSAEGEENLKRGAQVMQTPFLGCAEAGQGE